jgi:ribosomal protein S3AE
MAERRKYIDVKIPLLDSTMRVLGTPEQLHQKTIKLDLTRKLRGKGVVVTFEIANEEGNLIAVPKKIEIVKAYVRKVVRKRADYVEDSFVARCADIRAVVKPLLVTRKKVSRAVRKNLRNTAREFLLEYLKKRNYNDICQELMDGTLQKTLLPKLKKVYPLSFCDLRIFETKEIEKLDLSKIKIHEELTKETPEDIQGIPEEKEIEETPKKESEESSEELKEIKEEIKEEPTKEND